MRNSIIVIFVFIFIALYFQFFITSYISPNNFEVPIILLFGFALIIISIYYFFFYLRDNEPNRTIFKFKIINENTIKIIIAIFMILTFFIQPILFSKAIIDWSQIGFFNYFRAIIFLIGCIFLPGASLYKIFLSNYKLHKKINIESFFLKITIYPILSFSFLGFSTLILDQIGLESKLITLILLILILTIISVDLLIQKFREKTPFKISFVEINISKYTLFILFIALAIIIIAFGIHISVQYLIPFDSWRGINFSFNVGCGDIGIWDNFSGFYTLYWGYISFSLSTLCGLPYINTNAMLFPFLYLIIFSIFLLMKILFYDLKQNYAILASIFIVTFSGFFILDSGFVSALTIQSIFLFTYRSYAFYSFYLSLFFFLLIKNSRRFDEKSNSRYKQNIILILAAIFLLQSFMIYFLPLIAGITFIITNILFSKNKKKLFKYFLNFLIIFILIFIIIDIISQFFFSWQVSRYLGTFLGFGPPVWTPSNRVKVVSLNSILIYSVLISFLTFFLLINKIYNKFFYNRYKKYYKINIKIFFILGLTLFSILFGLEICFNIILKLEYNYFTFYLDLIFLNIGFIGIIAISLIYISFKVNRQLFKTILSWGIISFGFASMLFFLRWFQNPLSSPLELSDIEEFYMIYWFTRNWYYLIIPLSIFSSIGLIELKKKIEKKNFIFRMNRNLRLIINLLLTSILIFFSITSTIINGIGWYNIYFKINGEQAQMFGWLSENVPHNSKILSDYYDDRVLDSIYYSEIYSHYFIDREIINSLNIYNLMYYRYDYLGWNIAYNYDYSCSVDYINETDASGLILKFNDQNNNGSASINISFKDNQEMGTNEFFIKTTNTYKKFYIDFSSNDGIKGISISINSSSFYLYNGSKNQKILDIIKDKWYKFEVFFECTNESYSSLKQYYWRAIINETTYGDFILRNNVSHIRKIDLISDKMDNNWEVFLKKFNFSWDSSFDIDKYIFNTPIIIKYLKTNEFQYFIIRKDNIIRNSQYNNLLSTLYKKKLFEYGQLSIYSILR